MGRVVRETNKGHSLVVVVGRLICVTWVVRSAGPTTCPSTEDSALVAVDYCIVKGSTSLGGPILGAVGLPGEGV